MEYKVGQHVRSNSGSIRPYGRIVEVQDIPEKGVFQLKLHSGWCVHPRECQHGGDGEEVEIIKECNCKQCKD